MTELDFDELDKAVNSLMGGVKEKEPVATSKTLDVSTTLAPDEAPAYGKLEQIAEKIDGETTDKLDEQTVSLGEEKPSEEKIETEPETKPEPEPVKSTPAPALTPAPAAQKSGRFMDVVHPSSDMRTKTAAVKPVSRVAATVAVPPPAKVAPVEEQPASDNDEDEPIVDVAGDLPPSSEPPVVLDTDNELVAATEPLSSPFLPDAKVEKRPLGGVNEEAEQPEETEEIEEPEPIDDEVGEGNSKMDVQSGKSSEDSTEHIPEEFKDELLAIEQSSATDEEQPAKDPLPIGPASIPKQYQEKQNTGDKSTGAIYDTDVYHKPLASPAKKKPVVLWVVIAILIIILGVAAGAAVYFLGVL